MPVVSRLYSPSEMGDFALYVAVSSIVGILASLRFDLAVVLAKDDNEAARLVWLGLGCSLVMAAIAFAAMLPTQGLNLLSVCTGVSIFAIGSIQSLLNWHSRHQSYRVLATRNAGEKLLVLVLGVSLGFWGLTHYGLILGQTAGLGFSLTYFFLLSRLPRPQFPSLIWRETLNRFSDFPMKNLPSSTLMAMSLFFPSILFAAFFSKADLGQFNLSSRVFEIPINLIGYTFSTVYYRHASGVAAEDRQKLFKKSLYTLTLLFVPAFVLVATLGPLLFTWFFGEPWRSAGELTRWISPYTCARLLFVSQAPLLLVQRKLNLDLLISALLLIAQLTGFAIGYWHFNSLYMCVAWMSGLSGLVFLFGLQRIYSSLGKSPMPAETVK